MLNISTLKWRSAWVDQCTSGVLEKTCSFFGISPHRLLQDIFVDLRNRQLGFTQCILFFHTKREWPILPIGIQTKIHLECRVHTPGLFGRCHIQFDFIQRQASYIWSWMASAEYSTKAQTDAEYMKYMHRHQFLFISKTFVLDGFRTL